MGTNAAKGRSFKRILRLILANLFLAFLISLFFFEGFTDSFSSFMTSMTWGFAVCITQWIGHGYFYDLLDKKYSWQDHLVKRAILNSVAIIAYAVFAYLIVSLIMVRIVFGSFPENPISWALRSSYYAVIVSFAVSIVLSTIGFFQKWKRSLLEAEKLKGEMLRYKYESLQNQINPHFLFNSFNVLSDLVYEDQGKAVDFINQLGQLFRYVLDSREKELVPIADELEFINAYAYLLQTRFEDKLSIYMEVKCLPGEMIVPMTLQLLIENCVKHNEISAANPLEIRLSRTNGFLRVRNNFQPKKASGASKATGLSNIIQQYSYFTDKQINIQHSDTHFAVDVPVLEEILS